MHLLVSNYESTSPPPPHPHFPWQPQVCSLCLCRLIYSWGSFIRLKYPSHLLITCVFKFIVVVQSLSCVWLFVSPWTAAHQASLSITISMLPQIHVHWVSDAIQPSYWQVLFILPSKCFNHFFENSWVFWCSLNAFLHFIFWSTFILLIFWVFWYLLLI